MRHFWPIDKFSMSVIRHFLSYLQLNFSMASTCPSKPHFGSISLNEYSICLRALIDNILLKLWKTLLHKFWFYYFLSPPTLHFIKFFFLYIWQLAHPLHFISRWRLCFFFLSSIVGQLSYEVFSLDATQFSPVSLSFMLKFLGHSFAACYFRIRVW